MDVEMLSIACWKMGNITLSKLQIGGQTKFNVLNESERCVL